MAGFLRECNSRKIGVNHLAVALNAEDERDINADAFGKDPGDGWQTLTGGRNLNHEVLTVNRRPQLQRLSNSSFGIAGEKRRNLERNAAIDTAGGIVKRTKQVACALHITDHDAKDRCFGSDTLALHRLNIGSIGIASCNRAGEDGGIAGHADHVVVGNEVSKRPGGETIFGEVIEPDADA